MSTPDTFDEITSGLTRVSPWAAMFDVSMDQFLEARPEGFTVEEVGRLTRQRLSETLQDESWQDEAWDELTYWWWAARQDHPEAVARFEAAQPLRAKAATLLDEAEAVLARGAEVTPELVATLVSLARTLIGGAL